MGRPLKYTSDLGQACAPGRAEIRHVQIDRQIPVYAPNLGGLLARTRPVCARAPLGREGEDVAWRYAVATR